MTDIIPPWLRVMREIAGTQEAPGKGDNQVILSWAHKIGELYSEMAEYCSLYKADETPWCGLTIAYCMAMSGIRPVFGPADTDKWMWAQAWKQFGTATSAPQIGDVLVLARHVTMYAGTRDGRYIGLGGNQSDSVKESLYSADAVEAIRRPPQAAQISTEPEKPAVSFVPLDQRTIDAITTAAASSDLAQYSWRDRGRAPIGYIKGMAVTFGTALRKLAARDSAALAMVRVVEGPGDVFDQYDLGTLGAPDVDRLRALWTVLTGLGMRESSGNYSEGRDMSATNVQADTAEAGLFQMSWNANATSSEISRLLDAYVAGKYPGLVEIFREGSPREETENFGGGRGALFQDIAKTMPAFAVEAAAIGLRTLYTHWGPLIRHEAEVVPAADAVFRQVQEIVGIIPATQVKKDSPMPDLDEPQSLPSGGSGGAGGIPNLPAVPASFDIASLIKHIETFGPRAKRDILMGVSVYNLVWPKDQIVVADGSQPVPAPAAPDAATPALQRPSVILGTLGTVVSAVLAHPKIGAIGMDTGMLSGILSAGTAALGLTGGWGAVAAGALKLAGPLIGTIADKAAARLAANKAQQK